MKTAEIREMATADLVERLQGLQAEYQNLKLTHSVAPLENNNRIKATRRDIARMQTILSERGENK